MAEQRRAIGRRSWRARRTTLVVALLALAPGSIAHAGAPAGPGRSQTSPSRSVAPTDTSPAPSPSPSVELGSMYAVVDQIGARALWERGFTGRGVNVAVIDTGVANVESLSGADKVIAMVDLSAEATVPEAQYMDTYGHGTHMAGIIAGRQPGADPALARQHPEWFLGVAPDAGLVSVKVGDNTGQVDVSQVIAGVDWVVEHAAELDIRVINLSYGSASVLPYAVDPIAAAVERAWQAGIVVVAAVGNDGRQMRSLASPANDPYVVAVAAAEASNGGDRFTVPTWASSGDGVRNPDVSAPGAHIISLRSPSSRIDIEHPEGYVSETLFKGSGSSQAAAVVSGAVALLLDARPELSPDQVKALLGTGNLAVAPIDPRFSGAGLVQLAGSVDAPAPAASQQWPASDGSGSLDAARGDRHVVIFNCVVRGEYSLMAEPWIGARWTGARWTDGTWDGARWTGSTWRGSRWVGARWTGARWTGARWTGVDWTGARWTDGSWTASSWTGARWTGARWTAAGWADMSWSGARWSGASWT
jgi:serine protease AprX